MPTAKEMKEARDKAAKEAADQALLEAGNKPPVELPVAPTDEVDDTITDVMLEEQEVLASETPAEITSMPGNATLQQCLEMEYKQEKLAKEDADKKAAARKVIEDRITAEIEKAK